MVQEIEESKGKVRRLEGEKETLETRWAKFSKPHQYKHCYKFFLPEENTKTSCSFHPGRLKFYSCKGCGGDQYLSCCNYCKSCKEGCRQGEHVFS